MGHARISRRKCGDFNMMQWKPLQIRPTSRNLAETTPSAVEPTNLIEDWSPAPNRSKRVKL